MLRLTFIACLTLTACGPGVPQFDGQISPPARGTPFPLLVPLGPLLDDAEAILPRDAANEGAALETRAEDLRRRAAALRALEL